MNQFVQRLLKAAQEQLLEERWITNVVFLEINGLHHPCVPKDQSIFNNPLLKERFFRAVDCFAKQHNAQVIVQLMDTYVGSVVGVPPSEDPARREAIVIDYAPVPATRRAEAVTVVQFYRRMPDGKIVLEEVIERGPEHGATLVNLHLTPSVVQ